MAALIHCSCKSTCFSPPSRTAPRVVESCGMVCFPGSSSISLSAKLRCQRDRAISVITRAGPSSSSYIFAFVFPLSLLVITIFTSLRIGDRLDQKFLEELAINQAIREGDEEDEGDVLIPREEEPALPRSRNRPKREV